MPSLPTTDLSTYIGCLLEEVQSTLSDAGVEMRIARTAPPLRGERAEKPKAPRRANERVKVERAAMEFGVERVLRCRWIKESEITVLEITVAREIVRVEAAQKEESPNP